MSSKIQRIKISQNRNYIKTYMYGKNAQPKMGCKYRTMFQYNNQDPVVQRVDNFIHWIGRHPADKMCARFSR